MKLHLPLILRSLLLAASAFMMSYTLPHLHARGVVSIPSEAVDEAAAKLLLEKPTLTDLNEQDPTTTSVGSAYTLEEVTASNPAENLTIVKHIFDEASGRYTAVQYNVIFADDLGDDDTSATEYTFYWNSRIRSLLTTGSGAPYLTVSAVSNSHLSNNTTIDSIDHSFILLRWGLYGGAITNLGKDAKITTITGDFILNIAEEGFGGAIYNADNAQIGTITGGFIANLSKFGAAIYNSENAQIGTITGDFIANTTKSSGTIYNTAQINSITGDFIANRASVSGGAFFNDNNAQITTITGDFIDNRANESGGAIFNDNNAQITTITGDFIDNKASESGGAIFNANNAQISTITGDFIANASIYGGVLYNTYAQIGNITGDFIINYGSESSDAAIVNYSASLGLLAQNDNIIFVANLRDPLEGSDFYAIKNFIDTENNSATINFNAYDDHRITVNDSITGNSAYRDAQILNINNNLSGKNEVIDSGTPSYSTVAFNNLVENQTINVHAGTLVLGDFAGTTLDLPDGTSITAPEATAQLDNVALKIEQKATLDIILETLEFATDSKIDNEGTLLINLTDMTITENLSAILSSVSSQFSGTGSTYFTGPLSTNADYIDSAYHLNAADTLNLTEGTQSAAVSGDGALRLENASISLADGIRNTHTGGTRIAAGVDFGLTASNQGILGSGAVTLEAGSTLSLEGISLENALIMQREGEAASLLHIGASSSFTPSVDTSLSLEAGELVGDFTWTLISWDESVSAISLDQLHANTSINGLAYTDMNNNDFLITQQGNSLVLEFDLDFTPLDFSGMEITQDDINGQNLRYAKMQGVEAFGLDFSGLEITLADFTDANLQQSRFTNTQVAGVRWRGADLRGAKDAPVLDLSGEKHFVAADGELRFSGSQLGGTQTIHAAYGDSPPVTLRRNLTLTGAESGLHMKSGAELVVDEGSRLSLAGAGLRMEHRWGDSLTRIIIKADSRLAWDLGGELQLIALDDPQPVGRSVPLAASAASSTATQLWEFIAWEEGADVMTLSQLKSSVTLNGSSVESLGYYLITSASGLGYSLTNVKPGPDSYTDLASSDLGRVGGTLLDEVAKQSAPSPDLDAVLDTLNDISVTNAAGNADSDRLLAAVAGAGVTSLGSAMLSSSESQLQRVRNRMGAPIAAGKGNYWISAEASRNELSGSGNASGHNLNSWGGSVGADWGLSEKTSLGLALTALYGDLNASSVDSANGNLDNYYLSMTAQHQSGAWQQRAIVSLGLADASLSRYVSHANGGYNTKGDTNGYSLGMMYELAYTIKLGERSSISPIFNAALIYNSLDSYTETGSGGALRVGEQSNTLATFGVGARATSKLDMGLQLDARALFKADAGSRAQDTRVGLVNGTSSSTISGSSAGVLGVELGVGASLPLGAQGALFLDASLDLRDKQQNHSASVGYRLSF